MAGGAAEDQRSGGVFGYGTADLADGADQVGDFLELLNVGGVGEVKDLRHIVGGQLILVRGGAVGGLGDVAHHPRGLRELRGGSTKQQGALGVFAESLLDLKHGADAVDDLLEILHGLGGGEVEQLQEVILRNGEGDGSLALGGLVKFLEEPVGDADLLRRAALDCRFLRVVGGDRHHAGHAAHQGGDFLKFLRGRDVGEGVGAGHGLPQGKRG